MTKEIINLIGIMYLFLGAVCGLTSFMFDSDTLSIYSIVNTNTAVIIFVISYKLKS